MAPFTKILLERSNRTPDRLAYRFLSGDSLPEELTYLDLWNYASSLAALLRDKGLEGQRVLLALRAQRDFVIAFYACLLAQVIAVPTAIPRKLLLSDRMERLATDARATAVIFDSAEFESVRIHANGSPLLAIDLRSEETKRAMQARGSSECAVIVVPEKNDIAFLQYTSGSTGDPKGVVVTHGNLTHNSGEINDAMAITHESSVLTALPLFHDMGLIGGVLQPMFAGCPATIMSPVECAQHPEQWIQLISAYQITVSGGPNFMYELAVKARDHHVMKSVDLSKWSVAFCGAEPIRRSTVERFCAAFQPLGFNASAFFPCYGMAESTLFITGNHAVDALDAAREDSKSPMGCGYPRRSTRIAIVDPDTRIALEEGEVGEIWASGPSVAQGYWMRPELTHETFQATLPGQPDAKYLRTGDLGYWKDNCLYVTGRLKDLIIINGKNYAPQDLEDEVESSHEALRPRGSAAFSLSDQEGEHLVIVAELERDWLRRVDDWPQVVSAIRSAISRSHRVNVHDVQFLKPGALPKTSSGKVRRSQCRSEYEQGKNSPAVA